MNTEKQDGYFGRIRMTVSPTEGNGSPIALDTCTLFSYTVTPSSFFISKLSYFLFICVLFFGLFVTGEQDAYFPLIRTVVLVLLYLPLPISLLRGLFSGRVLFERICPTVVFPLFFLFSRPMIAIFILFGYHIFDTVLYLLIRRAAHMNFPVLPLSPLRFHSRQTEGKCSVGDEICLVAGDFVPADGVIKSGRCVAENSFLSKDGPRGFIAGETLLAYSRILEGSVVVIISALPSHSFLPLVRSRYDALTRHTVSQKDPLFSFYIPALFTAAALALCLIVKFTSVSVIAFFPLLSFFSLFTLPVLPPLATLVSLLFLKKQFSCGFLPALDGVADSTRYPFADILQTLAAYENVTPESQIAVKTDGKHPPVSSDRSPVMFIAAKRNGCYSVLSLFPFSLHGLSEGNSVLMGEGRRVLSAAAHLQQRKRRLLVFLHTICSVLPLPCVALALCGFSGVILLTPVLIGVFTVLIAILREGGERI